MRIAIIVLLAMIGSVFAGGEERRDFEPPGIVMEGFGNYYRYDAKTAVETWIKGSQLDGNTLVEPLARLEQSYGRILGYEKIRCPFLTPYCNSYARVYMLIRYEKGPGFVTFDCYRPNPANNDRWIVMSVKIDKTPPEGFFP